MFHKESKINYQINRLIDFEQNRQLFNYMTFIILINWNSGKRMVDCYCKIFFFKYICIE